MVIDRFSETITPQEWELWLSQVHQDLDGQGNGQGVNWEKLGVSFDDVCEAFTKGHDNDPGKILEDARVVAAALDKGDFLDEIDHYKRAIETATANNQPELAQAWERQLKKYRKSFDGCFAYVNNVLDFHITATARLIKEDKQATEQYIEAYTTLCIDTVIRLGYKPPKHDTDKARPSRAGVISGEMKTMPSGEAVHLINYAMAHSENLRDIPGRKALYNHSQQILVRRSRSTTLIDVNTGRKKITIGFNDVGGTIKHYGKAAQRLVNLILQTAARTCIDDNGNLFRGEAYIPIKDLVGPGMYKTAQSAEKALEKITPQLSAIVTTTYTRGRTDSAAFFKRVYSDASGVHAILNDEIAWRDVLEYYTYMPDYYRALRPLPASLFFCIFLRARQNVQQIRDQGYFTISYRAIWDWLGLPDDTTTKNPGRDIIEKIDTATEQIEEAQRQFGINTPDGKPGFTLEPITDDTLPITRYLDTSYLKVGLKGQYMLPFTDLASKTKKKQTQADSKGRRENT